MSVSIIEPEMPKDPHLRTLADDVLGKLRLSFAAEAADEGSAVTGELDRVFRSFLATRDTATRTRARDYARALLNAPEVLRTREFRRYAAIGVQEYRTLGSDQLASRVGNLSLDKALLEMSLRKLTKTIISLPPIGAPAVPPDLKAGLAFKKMKLFISRVRCLEETDEVGDDEINLGGNATDPFGNTSLVNQFKVSEDVDSGDTINFGMSRVFHTWNIATKPEGFPYVYAAVISMAEKDSGGFFKFLKALWEKVEAEVKAAIGAAVGAAVGMAIGAAFAGVGAIVGAIVGALIGWILSALGDNQDDIVGTKSVLMTLGAATKSYYDWAKLTSPQGWTTTLKFYGDGGKYEVDLAYRIFTE